MLHAAGQRLRAKLGTLVVLAISAALLLSGPCVAAPEAQAERASPAQHGREEEVRFANGATSLAGTLFWPTEHGNWPAVVVLAGSDRSERGGMRTAIARHFGAHGVAALVYDSPGTGASSGNALVQSIADRVVEALAAVAYLRELQGIRSTAVGLLGGSEGANIALLAGAENPGVAFVIPVSGSLGVSIIDILSYSAEKKGYEQGLSADEIAQATTFKEIAFALLAGVDIVEWPLIESRVRQWEGEPWSELIELARQRGREVTPAEKHAFLDSFQRIILHFETQRWFAAVDVSNAVQRLLGLDADTFFDLLESGRYARDWERSLCFSAADLRCPVLAIWGEEDSFLPPRQSAERLKKYLLDSNHPDFEVIVFPDASHFLTPPGSRTGFVPGYLDTLVTWIDRRFGAEARSQPPRPRN